MNPANRAIADEIKAYRTRRGWIREELAEASGVPAVTLERYENARRAIPVTALFALTAALGVPMSELIADAERHDPKAFEFLAVAEGVELGGDEGE